MVLGRRFGGSTGSTSRSRAGLRLHPEVGHGARRRRWCEWEQPHTLSWCSASADDAEWMSGKSRARLAPGLDRGFLMDVGPQHARALGLRASVERPEQARLAFQELRRWAVERRAAAASWFCCSKLVHLGPA